MQTELLILVVVTLGTLVMLPFIHDKPGWIFWGAVVPLMIALIVTAFSWRSPEWIRVNTPMTYSMCLFVIPTALAVIMCRLSALRDRRKLMVALVPATYLAGASAGLLLAFALGLIQE